MKKFSILLLLSFIFAQQGNEMLQTEVRTRLMVNDIIKVVVQVNNNSDLTIEYLEGFLTIYDGFQRRKGEKRFELHKAYEPGITPGNSVSRSINFNYDKDSPRDYGFHVSKVKFKGDHRIYTYNPACGLIRID